MAFTKPDSLSETQRILWAIYEKLITNAMAAKLVKPYNLSTDQEILYAIYEAIDAITNGSTTNIITGKTYEQILIDKTANNLTPGAFYLIPDYKTYQFIPGTDTLNTASAQYTGTIEPLLVFAMSNNQFSTHAMSMLYPSDYIEYEFDNRTETSTGPAPVTKTDKPGTITYRKSAKNLAAYYDWRSCLFRRTKITDLNTKSATWDGTKYNVNVSPIVLPGAPTEGQRFIIKFTNTNTLNNPTIVVTDGVTTYAAKSLKKDDRTNYGISGVTANSYGYLVYETATNSYLFTDITSYVNTIKTGYWSYVLTGNLSIGNNLSFAVNSADFTDYHTFDDKEGGSFKDYHIERYIDSSNVQRYNNIVIKGSNSACFDVKFGQNCRNMTLSGSEATDGMSNVHFYAKCFNHIHTSPLRDSQINSNYYYPISPSIGTQDCLSIGSSSFNVSGLGYNITLFSPGISSIRMSIKYMSNTTLIGSFVGDYDVIEDCLMSETGWNRNHMTGFIKNKTIIGNGIGSLSDCLIQSRSDSTQVVNYSSSKTIFTI